MIKVVMGSELSDFPSLANSMFKDRAWQFRERLKWDVRVDEFGREIDQYDQPDTLYLVHVSNDGLHFGSMRLRPTTTANMTKDHFSNGIPEELFVSPKIWECTRFCVSPVAPNIVALSLFTAGAGLMKELDISAFLGVFDHRMKRLYRRYGIAPRIISSQIDVQGRSIDIGLWFKDDRVFHNLLKERQELRLALGYA